MTEIDELTAVRDTPGTTIGGFRVVRELARGGMAVVYLARQLDLNRDVALKELGGFHASDPSLARRFLAESRIAGSMSHPNVVTVHDYIERAGVPYIAMEYLERGSLRPRVGGLTLAQVGGVLECVLAALQHAHERGVVHRDLKPENLMVTSDGTIKVADFGIAKALYDPVTRGTLTATGMTVGTPAYMAPEQAMGHQVGPQTDLYSVGVIAYELLAGKVPFHGADTPWAILHSHIYEPPPPLTTAAGIDPQLAAWVERLLAKAPEERPASAVESWHELEEILVATLGPLWRRGAKLLDEAPPARVEATPAPEPEIASLPQPTPVAEPDDAATRVTAAGRRRWRPVLVAAGLASVVAAGAAGPAVLVLGGDGRGHPSRPAHTRVRAVIETEPRARDRVALIESGRSLFAATRGRITRLDARSLTPATTIVDASNPQALAAVGDRLYVAGDGRLAVLRAQDLTQLSARRFGRFPVLSPGPAGTVAAAATTGPEQGRLCLVSRARLGPCTDLGFRPSGIGFLAPATIVVADRADGALLQFRRRGPALLMVRNPIATGAGSRPHGTIAAYGGRLFVPVARGVAVVDPLASGPARTIRLPATPSAIWVAPSTGRLFASLFGRDRVAVVDLGTPEARPLLASVGRRPVALAGGSAGGAVYVASIGDRRLTRLDARSGGSRGSRRLPLLGARPIAPAAVEAVEIQDSSAAATITLRLHGRLNAQALVTLDPRIADGRAALALRQGGIRAAKRDASRAGVEVHVRGGAAGLAISIGVRAGAFTDLTVQRPPGLVRIVLAKTPPPPTTTTGGPPSNTGGTSTTSRGSTGTTSHDHGGRKVKYPPQCPNGTCG